MSKLTRKKKKTNVSVSVKNRRRRRSIGYDEILDKPLEKWKFVNLHSSNILLDYENYDDLSKKETNIYINNGVLQPGCYENQNEISHRK